MVQNLPQSQLQKQVRYLSTRMLYLSIQYVRKSETLLKIRLNNYRTDVKNLNAIPASKHFNRHDHEFKNHGKIIIIEQLRNIRTISTETLEERLK